MQRSNSLSALRLSASLALFALVCALPATPAAKPHVITYGKQMAVKLFLGPDESHNIPIRVRGLFVDGKLREFITGDVHEVTDRLFVVRRAFRLNNSLPEDEKKLTSWVWQRGGWLLVDRLTGHVSQVPLTDFDPFYSDASWFRDYAAYCGLNDAGDKLSAVVMQLGRRKPLMKKELGPASLGDTPDSACSAPTWERKPTRVTFQPANGTRQTYTVLGHAWDAAPGSDDE
ncbi:MAG: hypothetical protein P4M01_03860 [Acidobacteriota bacterium]|nr:hypothetical protein [Acidobacteriota bacterium]